MPKEDLSKNFMHDVSNDWYGHVIFNTPGPCTWVVPKMTSQVIAVLTGAVGGGSGGNPGGSGGTVEINIPHFSPGQTLDLFIGGAGESGGGFGGGGCVGAGGGLGGSMGQVGCKPLYGRSGNAGENGSAEIVCLL